MLMIFNKQFRTEEKIISELIKKIKKSKKIVMSYVGNAEVYELDTIDISFDTVKHELLVEDKSGKKIMSLDCNYDMHNEMQQARSNWFHEVLNKSRERYDKESAALEKQEKWKKSNKKATAMNNLKKQQQGEQTAALKALERIKGL